MATFLSVVLLTSKERKSPLFLFQVKDEDDFADQAIDGSSQRNWKRENEKETEKESTFKSEEMEIKADSLFSSCCLRVSFQSKS